MTLVHLVYVHGFQGNDTTFQSFPNDLQENLSARIPKHLDVKFQSSLYPTYKSVKPVSFATRNFLEWLTTQPPGPVILMGHSMGGLLAADAAIDASNNPDKYPGAKPKRIVGMIAFDTPYLGMHPHVVISGIASLFPKDDDEKEKKSESEMNPSPEVKIVDEKVTDDWDTFKKNLAARPKLPARPSESLSRLSHNSQAPPALPPRPSESSSQVLSQSPSPPSLPPRPSASSPRPSASSSLSPRPRSPSSSPLTERALNFISSHAEDPLVRWVRKHSDDPLSAGKKWVIEHFQFGATMFDPSGLKDRYAQLVSWKGGMWVNYWTQTVPRRLGEGAEKAEELKPPPYAEDDVALIENRIAGLDVEASTSTSGDALTRASVDSSSDSSVYASADSGDHRSEKSPEPEVVHTVPTKSEMKTARKEEEKQRKQAEKEKEKILKKVRKQQKAIEKAEKEKNKMKPGRHFIVLPTGIGQMLGGGENWEKVLIGGVEDEVAAHCGLFIRGQNLDYDGLVERVGTRILGWCDKM